MTVDSIRGIICPIVTPINSNEEIDEISLRNQVDFMIEAGVLGVLVFGSNGEFYMLNQREMKKILKIVVNQVNGRVPVYMGIGAIRTKTCLDLVKLAIENGADAVSLLQPMFIKPNEDELKTHFKTIINSFPNVLFLFYNNPGRTGYPISQGLVEELAHKYANLVGIKDSGGDITETSEFIRRNKDIGFKVLCGKDTQIFSGLMLGAVGAVCSTANFVPKLVCSIYNSFLQGDYETALKSQFTLNPIRIEMDASSFPVATKDYANLLGRKVGSPFLPNKPSNKIQMEGLKKQLDIAGLL